jgi:hypothetical protein
MLYTRIVHHPLNPPNLFVGKKVKNKFQHIWNLLAQCWCYKMRATDDQNRLRLTIDNRGYGQTHVKKLNIFLRYLRALLAAPPVDSTHAIGNFYAALKFQ